VQLLLGQLPLLSQHMVAACRHKLGQLLLPWSQLQKQSLRMQIVNLKETSNRRTC
jgi:hypothetical protein